MIYIDYLIGLGAGVVITLILRAVSDARREKEENRARRQDKIDAALRDVNSKHWGNEALSERIGRLQNDLVFRIDKLESELWDNPELKHIKRKR